MAENLLMRNLPAAVNAALAKYKTKQGLKNNTDAAKEMMTRYFDLENELMNTRKELRALEDDYNKLLDALRTRLEAEKIISKITTKKS